MTIKADGYFHHTGGGCMVTGSDPFPCDDEYERSDGAKIVVHCTRAVHFEMPLKIKGAHILRDRDGVGKVEEVNVMALVPQ